MRDDRATRVYPGALALLLACASTASAMQMMPRKQVQDEPRDFKVRLNGSEVVEMLGQDITGKFCSTVISGPDSGSYKTAFDICVDQCRPVIVETSLAFCGKPYMAQTIIVLPLSSAGESVDMIVTAHSYHAIKTADQPIDLEAHRNTAGR